MKSFTFFLCLLFCAAITAQSPFVYTEKESLMRLEKGATYFVDSSKTMSFETVQQLPLTAYRVNQKESFNLGNTDLPLWLRLDFENQTTEELYLMLENHEVRYVDAYLLDERDSVVKTWQAGVSRPFGGSFFRMTKTTFDLGRQPKRLFIKMQTPSMYVLLKLGAIQPFVNYVYKHELFYSILLGILLALSLYVLFLFFIIKDRLYFYHFLYATSCLYLVLKIKGLHHQYLWHDTPFMTYDVNISSTFVLSFSVLFFIRFLDTKRVVPIFHKIIIGLWALAILTIPAEFMFYQHWLSGFHQILGLIIMFLQLFVSAYVWWSGFTTARFYVVAWAFGNLGFIVALLAVLGVLSFNDFIVFYAFEIGLVLEALFMAFAVADRINIFKKEARDANALALQRAYENEALMTKQTQLLEEKLQLEKQQNIPTKPSELPELLEMMRSERNKNRKLNVPTTEGVLWIPMQDIIRLEAMRSYCAIYSTNGKRIIAAYPLADFEKQLDSSDFMRVHKSHLVNLNQIQEYIRGDGGSLVLKDGSSVSVSRTAKAALLERLAMPL